ncbi:MAG: DUF6029 family protein [Sphingobacteriales bacterium]|jgi:hypothetical protein|nr:DUF6029 family protein [Sphingobacteriales bacterium]
MKKLRSLQVLALLLTSASALAQNPIQNGTFSGYFETNGQYYRSDSSIKAVDVPEKWLNNAFMSLSYTYGNLSMGVRYESYLNAIQGFDQNYRGNGLVNRYLTYSGEKLQVTAGHFYEQFGNGLVLRSYWEPNLGIDNALDGVRAVFQPEPGITLKGVIGRQRDFFDFSAGIVRGVDGDFQLNDLVSPLKDAKLRISMGGSFVSKYQRDTKVSYNLPENVGNAAGRFRLGYGKFSFDAEYAYKINDPSLSNEYTYNSGESFFTNLTYAKKGLGVRLSAKRVDNMDYRSDRDVSGNRLLINYLPAVNRQQTYRLATLYPYATQLLGEMGGSAEVYFTAKPKSTLGGEFGTTFLLSFAAVNDIERKNLDDTLGYDSDFFAIGEDRFYQEATVEVSKKLSKKSKFVASYVYMIYDRTKLEGKGGEVTAHLNVFDFTHKFEGQKSIRFDLEHLYTQQDRGSWAMALVEINFNQRWSIAVFDEWNYGNEISSERFHYYNGLITYVSGGTRLSAGWARQRAGLLCVGGVCRFVPASNGLTLTISSRF